MRSTTENMRYAADGQIVMLSALPLGVIFVPDGAPAIILASGVTAALVLPIVGRALDRLPEWGMRILAFQEAVSERKRKEALRRRRSQRSERGPRRRASFPAVPADEHGAAPRAARRDAPAGGSTRSRAV